MKTFQDFLQEQQTNEGFKDFIKDYGLEDAWKTLRNRPKPITAPPAQPKGWKLNTDEIMRDIHNAFRQQINSTTKVNRFGIDDIKFEIINSEEVSQGVQLNMEAQGTAFARNPEHIKKLLAQLVQDTRKVLGSRGIYIEMLYNRLDVSEAVEESDEGPAIGLVRKYSFRIISAAVVNTRMHKQNEQ